MLGAILSVAFIISTMFLLLTASGCLIYSFISAIKERCSYLMIVIILGVVSIISAIGLTALGII